MFGLKQAEINELRKDLAGVRKQRDEYWDNWRAEEDVRIRAEQELSVLQEAFRNGCKITDDLKEKVAGLQKANVDQSLEVANLEYNNDALARKNRDLEY